MNDLRVKDLKTILEKLPDDMMIVIPVIDAIDVNNIDGFRKVRTAGVLVDDYTIEPCDRKVLCLNGAAHGADIADQVRESGLEVSVETVLYAYSKYDGPVEEPVR